MIEKFTMAAVFSLVVMHFSYYAPLLLLLFVVLTVDYTTGMIKGYVKKSLSSQVGILGLLKKLCYLFCIVTAFSFDLLVLLGGSALGLGLEKSPFGVLVTLILIINELLSICENLGEIGVPLPKALVAAMKRLSQSIGGESL